MGRFFLSTRGIYKSFADVPGSHCNSCHCSRPGEESRSKCNRTSYFFNPSKTLKYASQNFTRYVLLVSHKHQIACKAVPNSRRRMGPPIFFFITQTLFQHHPQVMVASIGTQFRYVSSTRQVSNFYLLLMVYQHRFKNNLPADGEKL